MESAINCRRPFNISLSKLSKVSNHCKRRCTIEWLKPFMDEHSWDKVLAGIYGLAGAEGQSDEKAQKLVGPAA